MTVSAAIEPASAIAVVSLIAGPAHAPDWLVLFPFLSMAFSIPMSGASRGAHVSWALIVSRASAVFLLAHAARIAGAV
jgi:hypothetical protein